MPSPSVIVEEPKLPISSDLLTACVLPIPIARDSQLPEALKTLASNHKQYANCYLKQEALIDAVKARGY